MLRVAEQIVETKTSDFDPAILEDRYRTVLISKLEEEACRTAKEGCHRRAVRPRTLSA
jgi:non-homologous end joining protein Ku